MELKTIKDLVSWTCECNCVTFDGEICRKCGKSNPKYGEIDFEDLRQSAIDDIKELRDGILKHSYSIQCAGSQPLNSNVVDYIKWKFNLTEEDLK